MSPHKGGQSPSEYYDNDILEFGGQQGKYGKLSFKDETLHFHQHEELINQVRA